MEKKKKFYTLQKFDHPMILVKDGGLFPYYLGLLSDYDTCHASFVRLDDKQAEQYAATVPTLRREYISGSVAKYIWQNAKKIDILNLYHIKPSFWDVFLYRFRNRKGIIWLKTDITINYFPRPTTLFNRFKIWCFKQEFKCCDLITVETQKALKTLQQLFPTLKDRIKLLYNSIDDIWLKKQTLLPAIPFENKENIMITVARLGTEVKNTPFLLEVLKNIQWKGDWKMYAIGSIEEKFQPEIDAFFEQYPFMKERLIFTGNITDRIKLFDYYRKAKIFLLTSRSEGFSLAVLEALCQGDFFVTTPIDANPDYGLCCKECTTPHEMSDFLSKIISDETMLKNTYQDRLDFSERFYMSNTAKKLYDYLDKIEF